MKLHVAQVALLLPLLLTACVHTKDQVQNQPPLAPPIEDTPPPKPDNAPTNLPPPVISVPQPAQPAAQTEPPPAPPKHHKPKPAQPADTAQNNTPPANETAQVDAVGKLSSGEPADLRKQTSDSIADTERGLGAITRKLSDQEQKTSDQIREYLKQAKAALSTGDIDGAHTLALKAKVLLSELNQ